MKLAAIPQPDTRTTTKIFALIIIQAFIPVIVYKLIFQTDIQPAMPAYLLSMIGLALAVYRINAMPFWLNMLITVILTVASVCGSTAGTLYL